MTLRVTTTPSPTHRPRVTRQGWTYYAKSYQAYMKDCLQQFSQQAPKEPLQGQLGATVEVIVTKPKTTKLAAPRGDVDNYSKACLDAATKARVWGDDTQLVCVGITKRWAEPGEEAGVVLHVSPLDSAGV